jgi:chorismate dehydratase
LTEPASQGHEAGESVRVGRIEFVNCFPLYHHFARELATKGVGAEIVEGYPAALNEMLVEGAIDVTLSSSIAFARNAEEQALLPQVSISSFGAVDSIQLFARTPLARIRRVALTEKSATSICLLKVLCREWGIEPEVAPRRGPLSEVLEDFDALLLIGDEALHLLRVEAYPHHFDLGAEWKSVTGLPMVYAVCAARRDFVEARPEAAAAVGAALLASRDACAAAPEATAAAAAQLYDFSQAYLLDYFDKLKFEFTPEYRAGLREFYRRAVAIGELDGVPDLDGPFAAAGGF